MFVRDINSGMLINTDNSHYKAILSKRSEKKRAEALCTELDSLKSEMIEIKMLLQEVLNGKKYD